MIARHIDHDVNILIIDELLNSFMKIKRSDKIKFRIVFLELLQKPCPFFF